MICTNALFSVILHYECFWISDRIRHNIFLLQLLITKFTDMKKFIIEAIAMCMACASMAQEFESAQDAVSNMAIGWNAGNRLDSNSGDVGNMWIEAWSQRTPADYEQAWGQPQITRELIHMFKEAGFKAIRVPVTWYPHMGDVIVDPAQTDWKPIWDIDTWTGYDIDPQWMRRVREVVDYVIDEDMYCILNVLHDTGAGNTAWLRADMEVYAQQKERFEALWTQIAEEFKDYGERLLFEGYNEMLDSYSSWCFASFGTDERYDADVATDAYQAINCYAQSFVDAVRATGGNNLQRNLVVCSYGACCGEGTWSSHLQEPLTELKTPEDAEAGHIAFEVHAYPTPKSQIEAKTVVDNLLSTLNAHLAPKGNPIIIGEWGIGGDDAQPYFDSMAEYLVSRCKEEQIATFLWMSVADGEDCAVPKWTNESLRDAIVQGYYGEAWNPSITATIENADAPYYDLAGRQVAIPSAKGFYIHNRKKIFIR